MRENNTQETSGFMGGALDGWNCVREQFYGTRPVRISRGRTDTLIYTLGYGTGGLLATLLDFVHYDGSGGDPLQKRQK